MKTLFWGLMCITLVGCQDGPRTQPNPNATSASDTSAQAAQASTPEKLVELDCLPCHDQLMLEQQRLTEKQWRSVVTKMQKWGSLISTEEVDKVTAYLAKRYPVDGPEYDIPTVPVTEVATRFAVATDSAFTGGDPGRGETLFQTNCVACHYLHGKGTSMAIALYDRRILQHPTEFAETVRKGRRRMLAFSHFTDANIADLLAYLRKQPVNSRDARK